MNLRNKSVMFQTLNHQVNTTVNELLNNVPDGEGQEYFDALRDAQSVLAYHCGTVERMMEMILEHQDKDELVSLISEERKECLLQGRAHVEAHANGDPGLCIPCDICAGEH